MNNEPTQPDDLFEEFEPERVVPQDWPPAPEQEPCAQCGVVASHVMHGPDGKPLYTMELEEE